ncbi:unnamed protein product [Notodromas monacha]|uniref:Isocitrate dehydrogenase n=1 Tax=Notodromas monacha TaxID=399045 RepID=A0A7R9C2B1_9CRUS|nr:unnamed protein product [Notodromas monacha]CAG0926103.1 unnamed protein product [Notodromas monacha]
MVRNAVTKVLLDAKVRTKDMGGYATSTEFTQAVIMNLNHR